MSDYWDQIRAEKDAAEEKLADLSWVPHIGFPKTDRILLAAALEAVRRKICAYGPEAKRCDCKYGLGLTLGGFKKLSHEDSGCPELKSVIEILLAENKQ